MSLKNKSWCRIHFRVGKIFEADPGLNCYNSDPQHWLEVYYSLVLLPFQNVFSYRNILTNYRYLHVGKYSFFSNVHLKKEKKFKLKTTGSNPKLYWYRTFLWLSLRIWIKSTVFTLLVLSYRTFYYLDVFALSEPLEAGDSHSQKAADVSRRALSLQGGCPVAHWLYTKLQSRRHGFDS